MFQVLEQMIFQKWGPLLGIFLMVSVGESIAKILGARRKKIDDPEKKAKLLGAEKGLIQKLGYLLLVGSAFLIDAMTDQITKALGWEAEITVLGGITLVWLTLNELSSLLQNIKKMGVPIPPYLTHLLQQLKNLVNVKTKNGKK